MSQSAIIRSSVRPKSSKQPWGTILQPSFGLGHQKMTAYEIEQSVNRLYSIKRERRPDSAPSKSLKSLSAAEVDAVVQRLTVQRKAPADSRRTQKDSIYSNMGPVNSFAWKGYN